MLDELGRQVAPGPFLPTVLASAVIEQCGSAEQKRRLLPGLADGTTTAALGLGTADLALADGTLRGDAGTVLGGRAADLLLFRVGDDVVIAGGRNGRAHAQRSARPRPHSPLGRASRRMVSPWRRPTSSSGAAERAVALARTLGAAEAVGGAAACVDDAVDYAKQRVQFGRTIGTFQAIKHHCADMLVAAELATAVVWDAARASVDGSAEEFSLVAAMAATLAFEPFVHNAQMNIQVHGGIGFTWEHDAHLYLRRALVLNAVLGTPRDVEDVTTLAGRGTAREVTLELPPEAEQLRAELRVEAQRLAALSGARATQGAHRLRPHGAALAPPMGPGRRCGGATAHR